MRNKWVIANWKLNGDYELVKTFAPALKSFSADSNVSIVVCPPAVFVQSAVRDYPEIKWGAQLASAYQAGAYTGEISADLLSQVGVHYVLVGHSERRSLFQETNESIAQQIKLAQQAQLKVVLCVGESETERLAGKTNQVVLSQLEQGLAKANIEDVIIAYEPVWAIGTGKTATPEQAQEVHALIRSWLTEKIADKASQVAILYGGSVGPANAKELFSQADIDGGLVGGASLKIDSFLAICQAAQDN